MPLTVFDVKNAKSQAKNYVLKDERGLYLEVSTSGGKWWRLRYTFNGKENRLSLGTYPDISLKDARERRDEARTLLPRALTLPESGSTSARKPREHSPFGQAPCGRHQRA